MTLLLTRDFVNDLCIQVEDLSSPVPEGFEHKITWANECLDGGASLTLKADPISVHLASNSDRRNTSTANLLPIPTTPLKKSKPSSPIPVQQMHLSEILTDSISTAPSNSSVNISSEYIGKPHETVSNSVRDLSMDNMNWNHSISKLHVPVPGPFGPAKSIKNSKDRLSKPKTIGQARESQRNKPQSQQSYNVVTNRSRPSLPSKISMHLADVVSMSPDKNGAHYNSDIATPAYVLSEQFDSLGAIANNTRCSPKHNHSKMENSPIIKEIAESSYFM